MLKPTLRQRFRIWVAARLFGLARRVSKGIEPRFLANAQEAFLVADREKNRQLVVGSRTTLHDPNAPLIDPVVSSGPREGGPR